jgi:hypothetical protein
LQHVTAQDKEVHYKFCCDFLSGLEDNELYTAKTVFNVEATFHSFENVTQHTLKIWRSNNLHEVTEHKIVPC